MKKIICLIMFALLLISCAKEEDLPPTPPAPGGDSVGRALAGMAAALPSWASEAQNVAVTPAQPYYNDGVVVSVSNFDYIYKNGYLFNSKLRTWEKFELQGELVKDWLKNEALSTVTISSDKFETGDNYLVVYACKKVDKDWECNNKKWMLVTFKVMGSATGTSPEFANVDEFLVTKKNVVPFELVNTFAEKDNFLDINVVRYDAKYKAPTGLIVVSQVFSFNDRADLDKTLTREDLPLKEVVARGSQRYQGHLVAVYLADSDHRICFWSSGKVLVWIDSYQKEAANKEIIEAYLEKYPSDLVKS